jgi:dehydrogenase/reductase SDR family member 7B
LTSHNPAVFKPGMVYAHMKNKVVIITGGSSGIGKALAREFGAQGSKILITGRTPETLSRTVEELQQAGITIVGFRADVSHEEDNKRMAEEAIRVYGKIDILINNAGISMRALFEDVDMEVLKKVIETNFYGVLYATKYCLPEILKNHGSVIGISSVAGYRGLPGRTGYSASKFALNGFLEVLRTELINRNVHVLTACPGYTTSNIRKRSLNKDGKIQGESPLDETTMMSAEECAHHIYKATVKRRKILILTKKGKLTVFINKWFPVWADKLVYNIMARDHDIPVK